MEGYTKTGLCSENIAGTKTEQNLHTALSGESQAYLRYLWFAKKAKQDGFVSVAELFATTAGNEREHAEIWFRYLGGWSSTERNLKAAASGEHFEWATMYDEFEKTAREEGFEAIAELFAKVADIERSHEENYKRELKKIADGEMFQSNDSQTKWICLNCGHVMTGKEPPEICPVCSHPQGYFTQLQQQ